MSEPKFAKGPWWLDEYNKWDIRGMSRADEAPPERGLRPCVVCSVNSWLVSADANAELLKAAPEMYEMLEYWLQEAVKSMNHHIGRWVRAGLEKESLLREVRTKTAIENIRKTKQLLRRIRGEA